MNADGSSQTKITKDPSHSYEQPAWSPDNAKIAFVRARAYNGYSHGPEGSIYVMDTEGPDKRELLGGFSASGPSCPPDGTRIASSKSGSVDGIYSRHIYSMNGDGSDVKRLTGKEE